MNTWRHHHARARRAQADQATVTLHRLLAQPLLLRVDGGGEHVGLAGCLVAAPPVLLGVLRWEDGGVEW